MVNLNRTKSFLFDLKCTKIAGGWGSAPDPAGGAYSAPPDPLAVRGGGKGEGRRWEGGGEGKGGGGRGGDFAICPLYLNFMATPLRSQQLYARLRRGSSLTDSTGWWRETNFLIAINPDFEKLKSNNEVAVRHPEFNKPSWIHSWNHKILDFAKAYDMM